MSWPGRDKGVQRPTVWVLASKASRLLHHERRLMGDCGVGSDRVRGRSKIETVTACISRATEAQTTVDTAWSRPGPGLQNAPSFVSAADLVAELHILGHSHETCVTTHWSFAPEFVVEGKFYKSRPRQAAETNDGTFQSPSPGLENAVSIVSPA